MENEIPRPDAVNKLRSAGDAAFAMLTSSKLESLQSLVEDESLAVKLRLH